MALSTDKTCSNNQVPADGSQQCTSLGNGGERCEVTCDKNGNSFSDETPTYYMCSKYGMWDQADRVTKFLYPSCGGRLYSFDIYVDV